MAKKVFVAGEVLRAIDVNEYLTDSRNAVINGGMDVWQRNTTSTVNNAYGSADRWHQSTSAGTTTFSRETTVVPVGSLYSMKIAQASATAAVSIAQGIETLNAIQFAGTNVVLSAYVAASASVAMTLDLFFSTSIDNAVSGSWTQITATSGGTVTPTSTTFVRGSGIFAVPATAKTLLVRVRAASMAAGVSLYIGQVQIEEGTVATPFRRAGANFQEELNLCKRYYQKSFLYDVVPADNTTTNTVRHGNFALLGAYGDLSYGPAYAFLEVEMRAAPHTVQIFQPNGTAGALGLTGRFGDVYNRANNVSWTAAVGVDANSGAPNAKCLSFVPNGGSGTSGNTNPLGVNWTASAEL